MSETKNEQFTLNSDNDFVNKLTSNVKSDVIVITEDKLENILLKHLKEIDISQSWITPLSLFVTIILALITTNFTDFILTKDTWKAIFIIGAVSSFIWLVYSLYQKNKNKNNTLEHLIQKIKNIKNT